MKRTKPKDFDFDSIPTILGDGILIIKRELVLLTEKSEKQGLTDSESKTLISYLSVLREVKKDYLAEVTAFQKELRSYSGERLLEQITVATTQKKS